MIIDLFSAERDFQEKEKMAVLQSVIRATNCREIDRKLYFISGKPANR